MPEDEKRGAEQAAGATYRMEHPIRYSAAAAALAGVIAGPLDLVMFGQEGVHALKVGVSSSATWFGSCSLCPTRSG